MSVLVLGLPLILFALPQSRWCWLGVLGSVHHNRMSAKHNTARDYDWKISCNMWVQDGYRVVQPEPVADEAVAPNSAETAELRRLTSEVTRLAEQWVERIR